MRTIFQLSDVNWRDDFVTKRWVQNHVKELKHPRRMSVADLATATTFCTDNGNPYAEEIARRAGALTVFTLADNPSDRARILREAAARLGVRLF